MSVLAFSAKADLRVDSIGNVHMGKGIINNAELGLTSIQNATINIATINKATISNLSIDSIVSEHAKYDNLNTNSITVDSIVGEMAVLNSITANSHIGNKAELNSITVDSLISNNSNLNRAEVDNLIVDNSTINYSMIDTLQTNYTAVKTIAFDGIGAIGNSQTNRAFHIYPRGVYYRDRSSDAYYVDQATQYIFSVGSENSAAYFYSSGYENTPITIENDHIGGFLLKGKYRNSDYITVALKSEGLVCARQGLITSSDRKLKKNINTLSGLLDEICRLNPVTYQFKDDVRDANNADITTLNTTSSTNEAHRTKYGFIAQEIAEIFPEVVYTMPSGELGIAYQEIIPILVSAIQELQAEVVALKSDKEEIRKQAPAALQDTETSTIANLSQNAPNPFNQATQIGYTLPEGTATAMIIVCDMNGQMLQTYPLPVNTTSGTLTIQAGSYTPGMYLYTLLVDGVAIDTKQMIILPH